MTIRQWSTTASGNANAASINWQEGQAPSTVNNSAREMMAQIRQEYTGERWGWIAHSGTASVASQTVFKISGNQTGDYVANRKVKLTGGSATVYADILSASYTSETTVTIQNASGSLSNSMSIAWLSAVYGSNLPGNVVTGSGTSTFTGVAVFQESVSFSASVKFGGFVSFSATISTIITIGQTLTTPTINVTSDAEGDTYYRNGSGVFSRLGIGTAGQVLTVNTGATAPEWADAGNKVAAWVNFNGTGTVSIRASHNVSSITDNGTGDYTINFTNALADANYALAGMANSFQASDPGGSSVVIDNNGSSYIDGSPTLMTSSAVRIMHGASGGFEYDAHTITVAVFR